ncbi:MAG: hypothetical protein OEX22_07490 [Cyclobacteriaceae bacterium]|nr:hypothetical protein [Cyclobacteriaceae bacterium]
MHNIEPYYNWLQFYNSSEDENSPFFEKEYNFDLYSENIYGYYIDPAWDNMGSETLYIKLLFVDYELGYAVIELIGEWNDTINNDIMHLKRNIIDPLVYMGINKFVLIGENVLNFHGSDDSYYEEWFEDVEEGWIVGINFHEHVVDEFKNYNIDSYLNMGGELQTSKWRTYSPHHFCKMIDLLIVKRLSL